jgi:hypothetical protein
VSTPAEPAWRSTARARHGQEFVDAAAAAAAALPPLTDDQVVTLRRIFASAPARPARTRSRVAS